MFVQQSEIRNILLGGHGQDNTETEVEVPVDGREPAAVGGAHIDPVEVPRATAHRPPSAPARVGIIIHQGGVIRIIFQPFGGGSFPDIAGHVQRAVGTGTLWVAIHRCSLADLAVKITEFFRWRLVTPGIF